MSWDVASADLVDIEHVRYIKNLCTERVEKYGLYSVKRGACKSCPYRYRGSNPLFCCTFSNLPKDWSDESIDAMYKDKFK